VLGREREFSDFVAVVEPRVRHALVALCGTEEAEDATAEGLAYAWKNWDRVRAMTNPAGYVYRVARSRTRRRKVHPVWPEVPDSLPDVEPGLPTAIARLPERQRVTVLLVYGWDWTPREVADLLEVRVSTIQTHLARGLSRLRRELGVPVDD
jgi:DNA-directed RNA polymerase specialized sigma24 family protein